jgi:acyl dehydratase
VADSNQREVQSADASVHTLTFENLKVGDRFPLGSHAVTRDEILEFASKYDPHPYHLSDAGAEANPIFERLSASGWHTAAITNLLITRFLNGTRLVGIAGIGVDEVRWLKPVYAGDVLSGELEILEARISASRPDRVVIFMRATLGNQAGLAVSMLTQSGIFARAPRTIP